MAEIPAKNVKSLNLTSNFYKLIIGQPRKLTDKQSFGMTDQFLVLPDSHWSLPLAPYHSRLPSLVRRRVYGCIPLPAVLNYLKSILGGPEGCVLGVIDDDVAVLLSSQPVRSHSLAASMGLPDDVGVDEVRGHVNDEVSVIPQGGQVVLVGGDDGATDGWVKSDCTEVGGGVDAVEVEAVKFLDPFFLVLHLLALGGVHVHEVPHPYLIYICIWIRALPLKSEITCSIIGRGHRIEGNFAWRAEQGGFEGVMLELQGWEGLLKCCQNYGWGNYW